MNITLQAQNGADPHLSLQRCWLICSYFAQNNASEKLWEGRGSTVRKKFTRIAKNKSQAGLFQSGAVIGEMYRSNTIWFSSPGKRCQVEMTPKLNNLFFFPSWKCLYTAEIVWHVGKYTYLLSFRESIEKTGITLIPTFYIQSNRWSLQTLKVGEQINRIIWHINPKHHTKF